MYLKNNNKFWSIDSDDSKVIIRFGKLSENDEEVGVQIIEKEFNSVIEAQEYINESLALKFSKGYEEEDQSSKSKKKQNNYAIKVNKPSEDVSINQFEQAQRKPFNQNKNQLTLAELTDRAVLNSSPSKSPQRSEPGSPTNLGNPCSKPFPVLLAKNWTDETDPTGWYMSEKLDGMRMIWTGTTMYSRNGNLIYHPKFFVQGWPKAQLDGELWLERDSFQKLVSITKKQVPDEEQWRNVKYMVFDAPGLKSPFRIRYERFKKACESSENEHLVCVPHVICKSLEHLQEELERVQNNQGEGLMLRDPESLYEGRRSDRLLKVKTFEDDEATVLDHEEGSGRCQGMLGALHVINSKGIEFRIGSGFNDNQRRHPPKIGTKVTYKFFGTSKKGVPRFPIYMHERPDE